MSWIALLVGVAIVIGAIVGLQQSSNGEDCSLQVAVSIGPQAWLVQRIGGDHVSVVTLVGPGESPATYAPSDAQLTRVLRSEIYFRIGVPFERGGWLQAIDTKRIDVIDLRQGVELRDIDGHGHHQPAGDSSHATDHYDPHIWLSPPLLEVLARTVLQALSKSDAGHIAEFERNYQALCDELRATDAAIHDLLDPHRGNAFFVYHPAWGYFADEYGLTQLAVEIGGMQPTDHELTELQRLARAEDVSVMFVQPQITGATADVIARAMDARVETADPLAAEVAANLLRFAGQLQMSFEDGD